MKLISKVLIALVIVFEGYTFYLWTVCQRFTDAFHFSSLDATLKLMETIRNDVGYEPVIARFFHNKLNTFGVEFLNRYLLFWDLRFDVLFFTIIGFFGILCGFLYIFNSKKKSKVIRLVPVGLILLPLVLVIKPSIPYIVQLGVVWLPFQIFSVYGLWQFMKHNKYSIAIIFLLLVLSFWYIIVFQPDIFKSYCMR